ncbi:MAG TPA: RNA repair transcriptional activator RtcR family protein [Bryobacteraceae bacterium]|nr:RNA repair transcriptional activator RtcR family protein [Bryobacteraceae bacterium]
MMISGKTLFAFVDPKDPFMSGDIAGEDQPGPILSLVDARQFDTILLFHTPHTRENAGATRAEVARLYPQCRVTVTELPVSDPKDYSSLMGHLVRRVRAFVHTQRGAKNHVCVSSGTAEMRAAWFLLAATGVLPAKLLQLGSPAEPLFGAANVREVQLDSSDWSSLRDLVMPMEYFPSAEEAPPLAQRAKAPRLKSLFQRAAADAAMPKPTAALPPPPGLDEALQELGIFIGSALMRAAAERAAIAAESDYPVLLFGETGTGKEMFAKLIHRMSERHGRPMVAVNCASIPKDLAESHLFGHVKGAFTGAVADRKGVFEEADGSTLFLDEVGELPAESQAKLLRTLQDGVVQPVGSNHARTVDVRIVAATNKNLAGEIDAGRFRNDLYYRLEVVQIKLPPLRKRESEISSLAATLLRRINHRRPKPRQLSKEAMLRLQQYDWPGNVRELSNVLDRSVLFARSDVLGPDDLIITPAAATLDPFAGLPEPAPGFSLEEFLAQIRKQLILRALERSNGNQSQAAAMLGLSKQAVHAFLKGENVKAD